MGMNILYLHSHDTGRCLQPYGHAIPTPHLQRLAEQGLMFRQAFCASPTCSPSRASLLTGQWPHCNGMLGLAHRGFRARDYSHFITYTLKRAGYVTALAGVQHEACLPTADPALLGYDLLLNRDAEPDCTVEAATRFLSTVKQPFFLSVGFFETHREFPVQNSRDSANHILPPPGLPDTPATRNDMVRYIAAARQLDAKVGAVLAALDGSGLADRTLVIYTTDHGIAFPGMKCTLTDQGLGVALILRGPGGFNGGRVCDAMVTHLDLYPTICEMLSLPPPGWLQGKSLAPLLRGAVSELHDAIFAEINFHVAYEPQRCVRTSRYKYIQRFDRRRSPSRVNCDDSPSKAVWIEAGWDRQPVAELQLYDLVLDPQEMRNLAAEEPHAPILASMRERLHDWMKATDDPLLHGAIAAPPGAVVADDEVL